MHVSNIVFDSSETVHVSQCPPHPSFFSPPPSFSYPSSPPSLSSSSLARSPLYSHISATLQGLTTIRACEREHASIAYFHAYQDEQTKGWLHYLIANRWFGMRIDLISSLFITIVSFSAIPLAGGECCQWVGNVQSLLDIPLYNLLHTSTTCSVSLPLLCSR